MSEPLYFVIDDDDLVWEGPFTNAEDARVEARKWANRINETLRVVESLVVFEIKPEDE